MINLKVLGKAMGFMFLPTLGVLLLLVVGFFDPIAMWVWIKSNAGLAVTARIIIFLLEIGLVTILYFDYLEKDKKQKLLEGKGAGTGREKVYKEQYVYRLWNDLSTSYYFYVHSTDDPNVKVLVREET